MIKLVVSDMDGTLINRKSEISKKNLEAIHRLKENNIEFAIASGRNYSSVYYIMERYGIECESILGNGAQYCDKDGHILMTCYLSKKVIKDVTKVFEERNLFYIIFTTKGAYVRQEVKDVRYAFIDRVHKKFGTDKKEYEKGGRFENNPCNSLKKINDIDEFLNSDIDIIKIESFSLSSQEITEVNEAIKDIPTISCLSSFDDNIEVTDFYAQKGLILEKVIALKGLKKEEVAVLGDGMNDLTMFECFPYSYAAGNGENTIKALAYKVVGHCEDDGFAQAIDSMLKEFNEE